MRSLPAATLTVATALVLSSGCAVAPSPSSSEQPSLRAVVLLAWATRPEGTGLLLVYGGEAVETLPLPDAPNGPIAAGTGGPLAFLSGPPERPVLWTTELPLTGEPQWSAMTLIPSAPQEEPLRWACSSPGESGRLAVQSNDTSLYLVQQRGRLRLLPGPRGLFRPGGCAWLDEAHLLVPLDIPNSPRGIAFAVIGVDDGTTDVLFDGGEDPAVADGSLAHASREGSRSVILVRRIPTAGEPLPEPDIRILAEDDGDLYRPILSADGTRIALLARDPRGRPAQLLVYDLVGEPEVILRVDVRDTDDAGPTWLASVPGL